jgi:gliding motility-associated-like protein
LSSYTVIGTTSTCTNQAVAIINVTPSSPTVTISGSNTICPGQNIILVASGANTYTWNTGEITQSILLNPTVTTSYTVIGGVNTCTSQAVAVVDINGVFNFTLPNIVTPNNDGTNDIIDFGKYQFSSLHLEIYNRWGLKVFESNNPTCIWKPTEDDGTYFYTAQYQINCNNEIQNKSLKGFITIIR